MKRLPQLSLLLAFSALGFAQSISTANPKDLLLEIRKAESDFVKSLPAGSPRDQAGLAKIRYERAIKAVEGVDWSKISGEESLDWSELFGYANKPTEAAGLAQKGILLLAYRAWNAQQTLLSTYVAQDYTTGILSTLRYLVVDRPTMLAQMGDWVLYTLEPKYGKRNPQLVLDAYDQLLARLDPSKPLTAEDKQWADVCYANTLTNKYKFIYGQGKKAEALSGLKGIIKRFANSASRNAFGGTPTAAAESFLTQIEMDSKLAPALAFDHTIGSFPGLTAWKGKVVLIDFFAHWCGPCKAAFPEVRDLYAEFKSAGLEVVGVTSYYGYYGSKQDIKPEQEFQLMKQFAKDFNMTWPIALNPGKKNMTSFNVDVIPHVVILDRAGRIRKVIIGNKPSERVETKAFIQKLLAEK